MLGSRSGDDYATSVPRRVSGISRRMLLRRCSSIIPLILAGVVGAHAQQVLLVSPSLPTSSDEISAQCSASRSKGSASLQPSAPPPTGMPTVPPTPSPLALVRSDIFGNRISCEGGTIPMRRITLEEFGAASQLELWYPTVDTSTGQYHSISQIWVEGYGGSATLQTAETGWVVSPLHFGTNAAVPFTYWTADNFASTGCFNLECAGFVQLNNNLILGAPNWSAPTQPGGQQVVINLQWQAQQNPDGTLYG
jgi:hypothetical protein